MAAVIITREAVIITGMATAAIAAVIAILYTYCNTYCSYTVTAAGAAGAATA